MDRNHLVLWTAFWIIAFFLLIGDLFVIHRKSRESSLREAWLWSILCIGIALAFCVAVFCLLDIKSGTAWLTAYLVEESLSVDNLFVFLIIFRSFHVHPAHQHRLLFWGVIGAIFLRFLLIFGGVALVARFHIIMYAFGLLLIYMGVRLAFAPDKQSHEKDHNQSFPVRLVSRFLPISSSTAHGRFLVFEQGRLMATPLLLVLVTIEFADLLFAVDSIPAVMGISQDFFVILTSNVFAIISLRAMFFVLKGLADKFTGLKWGIAFILVFIGVKMIIEPWFAVSDGASLGVIVTSLVLSGMVPHKKQRS